MHWLGAALALSYEESEIVKVTIAELDDWNVEEEVFTGLDVFTLAGEALAPSLTRHRDVVVTGRDWLPIKDGEVALLVHSPAAYFEKKHAVQDLIATPQGVRAHTGPIRDLCGTSILIGGSQNHYHWLVDYLPRLLMARQVMPLPRILLHEPTAVQRESLARVGVDRWETVQPGESVRCEDLWIPSLLARNTVAHPAVPALLRAAFPADSTGPKRKVYFSRRDATSRALVNEAELIAAVPSYETHIATGLDFQQQVNLFASAHSVLAVHGAGMANMVFCAPGSRVYEIFTPLHKVSSMYFLAKVSGLKHQFVPARNVTVGADGRPLLGTWEVDIDAVRELVH
jgi:hypothetical protein